MADIGRESLAPQPSRDLSRSSHRPVAPPCASERDGHVTFARGPVAGNPVDEKRFDALHRLVPGRIGGEIVADRLVLPGKRPKLVDPVRVGQESKVEHQVRGPGDAARKPEGGDGEDRLIFNALLPFKDFGESAVATVNCSIDPKDSMHGMRLNSLAQKGIHIPSIIKADSIR